MSYAHAIRLAVLFRDLRAETLASAASDGAGAGAGAEGGAGGGDGKLTTMLKTIGLSLPAPPPPPPTYGMVAVVTYDARPDTLQTYTNSAAGLETTHYANQAEVLRRFRPRRSRKRTQKTVVSVKSSRTEKHGKRKSTVKQ